VLLVSPFISSSTYRFTGSDASVVATVSRAEYTSAVDTSYLRKKGEGSRCINLY
jgi:hypothetical protein